MNNRIKTIQETLMRQLERLDDDALMNCHGANEVARSNALSQTANTVIKTANLQIRIKEIAEKDGTSVDRLSSELGLTDEK